MKKNRSLSYCYLICTFLFLGITQLSSAQSLLPPKHIDIYAHRGFRALAPENTLQAYNAALNIGVDVVDMDVNMTKDGVLVVTHDSSLNTQITQNEHGEWLNESIPIKNLTFNKLERFQVGNIRSGSHFHHMYPNHIDKSNVHISSLPQVIQFVKSHAQHPVRFQIEMKTDPTQPQVTVSAGLMATELAKIIKQYHIQNQVEVQAFQWQALVDLQQLIPGIKTGYLTEPDYEPSSLKSEQKIGTGQVWTAPLTARDFNFDYPQMIKKLGGTFFEPYEMSVTKEQIRHAHQLGLKIIAWGWTEQEHTDFNYKKVNQLIDWGIDGVITDRPDILRGLLAVKGYSVPKN